MSPWLLKKLTVNVILLLFISRFPLISTPSCILKILLYDSYLLFLFFFGSQLLWFWIVLSLAYVKMFQIMACIWWKCKSNATAAARVHRNRYPLKRGPCSGVFGRLNGRKIESVALPEHIDVLQRLINKQDFRKAEEKMSTANEIKERFNKV